MRHHKQLVFILGLSLLQSTPAWSRSWNAYAGPMFSELSLKNDFDGQHVIINQTNGDAFAVPKFDSTLGIGGLVGIRAPSNDGKVDLAMELSYQQGSLNNSLGGASNNEKATFRELEISGKSYFLADQSLQPFLAVGGDFSWVTVPGGEISLVTLTVQDATFRSIGYHAGGGLSYFVLPQLSLEVSFLYHHRNFDRVNGLDLKSFALVSNTFEPAFAIQYHFGRTEEAPISRKAPIIPPSVPAQPAAVIPIERKGRPLDQVLSTLQRGDAITVTLKEGPEMQGNYAGEDAAGILWIRSGDRMDSIPFEKIRSITKSK